MRGKQNVKEWSRSAALLHVQIPYICFCIFFDGSSVSLRWIVVCSVNIWEMFPGLCLSSLTVSHNRCAFKLYLCSGANFYKCSLAFLHTSNGIQILSSSQSTVFVLILTFKSWCPNFVIRLSRTGASLPVFFLCHTVRFHP